MLNPSTECSTSYKINSSSGFKLFFCFIVSTQSPKSIEEKSFLFKLLPKVDIKWESSPSFITKLSLLFFTCVNTSFIVPFFMFSISVLLISAFFIVSLKFISHFLSNISWKSHFFMHC